MPIATATLPNVHTNSTVRYFAKEGCVDYSNPAAAAVYVGGSLIGTFNKGQGVERDMLILVVCREPRVRMNRAAAAFNVSTETLRRIHRKYEMGGVQAIANGHQRGRPLVQTPELEEQLFALFDTGLSVSEAHARIDERVSRSVMYRTRRKWVQRRGHSDSESAGPAPDHPQATLPNSFDANHMQAQDGEAAIQSNDQPPSNHDPEEQLRPLEQQEKKRKLLSEPQEPDGEQLAKAQTKEQHATAHEVEPQLEEACVKGGRHVQYLGTWIVLTMLQAMGFYARAETLREEFAREQKAAGKKFIGRAALRAALDGVAIALSIGMQCVEGVRWLATPSGPTLLRRMRIITANWCRRVIGRFADVAAIELHWAQASSLANSATEGDERAVFYVDNHTRAYTGKHTIRKVWRMQDKRAKPGVCDYYVHDEEGRPLVRIDDSSNGPLTDWLLPIARLLREALERETKVLLVFDRAGAFPEQMASLRDDRLEFVTYQRGPYPTYPKSAFKGKRWLKVGPKRVRYVEAACKNLGKGRGRVRRIHVQNDKGAQFAVLAVSDAPADVLLRLLIRRWARQENQFKHEGERWGLNQLDGRKVEDYPADEIIPNPARRRLDRQLRVAQAAEGLALKRLAEIDKDHPKHATYKEDLVDARELQSELKALRPEVPTHAPCGETELAGKLVRHPGRYKLVIDTLRVALANVESDLAAWLGPELPRATEAKMALAKLFNASGNVRAGVNSITVTLAPAGTSAELRAFEVLLSRLNALELRLPGDSSGRKLRFKLHNK